MTKKGEVNEENAASEIKNEPVEAAAEVNRSEAVPSCKKKTWNSS